MKYSRRYRGKKAFTLIEMIVSLAVFGLMMLLFTQVIETMNSVWVRTLGTLDNFSRAQSALGVLQSDLASAVVRSDLGAFVNETGQTEQTQGGGWLNFYSERPGANPDGRQLSLLSYQPAADTDGKLVLKRRSLGIGYSQPDLLTFGESDRISQLLNGGLGNQVLVGGLMGFTVQFLDTDGRLTEGFVRGKSRAAVITMAVIDGTTENLLNSGQRQTMQTVFQNTARTAVTDQKSVRQLWEKEIDTPSRWAGYPAKTPASVKVFERVYQLPEIDEA